MGTFVLPSTTAPASTNRWTAGLFRVARKLRVGFPRVVGRLQTSKFSLMVIGTPCNGPIGTALFRRVGSPTVVGRLQTSLFSLTVIGTPCNGPTTERLGSRSRSVSVSSPLSSCNDSNKMRSNSLARSRAASKHLTTTALIELLLLLVVVVLVVVSLSPPLPAFFWLSFKSNSSIRWIKCLVSSKEETSPRRILEANAAAL
mmetsp:Transcript_733/g.1679  ORF Transcript_733/g.1679 Transcript_733/m.1679 type:complete len:201 (+) Transcript_733:244-846(+)